MLYDPSWSESERETHDQSSVGFLRFFHPANIRTTFGPVSKVEISLRVKNVLFWFCYIFKIALENHIPHYITRFKDIKVSRSLVYLKTL